MKGRVSDMAARRRPNKPRLEVVTDKALCSTVCRAACCSWGFVELTEEEAERMHRLADKLGVEQPTIMDYVRDEKGVKTPAWVMHATPCTFLGKDKLCRIYKDRPEHCRDFPNTWREWCYLSHREFPDEKPTHDEDGYRYS